MGKEIFDLTERQQRAFNRFEKAYADCIKENIFFFNNYGALTAVDKAKICGYGDSKFNANGVAEVSVDEIGEPINSIKIANEWSDDTHYYGLTKLGSKLYFTDNFK